MYYRKCSVRTTFTIRDWSNTWHFTERVVTGKRRKKFSFLMCTVKKIFKKNVEWNFSRGPCMRSVVLATLQSGSDLSPASHFTLLTDRPTPGPRACVRGDRRNRMYTHTYMRAPHTRRTPPPPLPSPVVSRTEVQSVCAVRVVRD